MNALTYNLLCIPFLLLIFPIHAAAHAIDAAPRNPDAWDEVEQLGTVQELQARCQAPSLLQVSTHQLEGVIQKGVTVSDTAVDLELPDILPQFLRKRPALLFAGALVLFSSFLYILKYLSRPEKRADVSRSLRRSQTSEEFLQEWQRHCAAGGACLTPTINTPCITLHVVDPLVQDLANKEKKVIPMSSCIGPCLNMQVFNLVSHFIAKIVLLGLGLMMTTLDKDSPSRLGLHLTMLLVWILCTADSLHTEYCCLKHTTIPCSQVQGRFKILGIQIGFSMMCFIGFSFSLLDLMGLYTNAIFTAKNLWSAIRTDEDIIVGAAKVSEAEVWCHALNRSLVPPGVRPLYKELVVGIAWALTAAPEIYSLFRFLPKPGQPSKILRDVQVRPFSDGQVDNYQLLVGGTTSTGAAVFDMAEGCGFGTIRSQTPGYPVGRADEVWNKIDEGNIRTSLQRSVISGLRHINGILPRAVLRLLLESLGKNVGQANVQTMLFAINRLHNQGDFKWFEVFSIVVNLMPAFKMMLWGIEIMHISRSTFQRVQPYVDRMDASDPETAEVEGELKTLKRRSYILLSVWLCLVSSWIYVLAKLLGALVVCPFFLFNMSPPWCVNLAAELDAVRNCTLR